MIGRQTLQTKRLTLTIMEGMKYGVRHMVNDHSGSERGNLLPPHRLLFPINSKGSFISPSHRQDSTSCGALAELKINDMY